MRLTRQIMESLCARAGTRRGAHDLARALGGLAPWLLRPATLALAAEYDIPSRAAYYTSPRLLPNAQGSCGILFTAPKALAALPALRDEWLLPLAWRADSVDDPRLPPAVAALARQVRGDLEGVAAVGGREWGLHLHPAEGVDPPDLREVEELQPASGWAALAGGLIVLAEGGTPNPRVLSTAVWDHATGVGGVDPDTLPAKVRFAQEYGASRLFVPPQQADDAKAALAGIAPAPGAKALDLKALEPGFDPRAQRFDAATALRPLLAALEVPPGPLDSFHDRRDFYVRQAGRDGRAAEEFYRERLLTDVVEIARKGLTEAGHADGFPCLVTFVSHSWETVPLAAAAVRARRCVLLHTPTVSGIAEALRSAVEAVGRLVPPCLSVPVAVPAAKATRVEDLASAVADAIREHLDGVSPGQIAVDLTPGTKLMTVAGLAAAHPGTWLIYLSHEFATRTIRKPGTERYESLRAGGFPR